MIDFDLELVRTRYGNLWVIKEDLWVSQSLRVLGEWCQQELEVVEKVLETIGNVEMIEGGGFVGDHTIPLARLVKKLHVFEPVEEIREVLELNLQLNKVQNVEVYPFALGPENKQVSFNIGDLQNCITSTQMQNDLEGERVVEMRTIDSFGLPVGLVKLDIEGCELGALVGAQETMKTHCPVLFVEENPGQPTCRELCEIWSYYHYWTFHLPVWQPGNFNQTTQNPYGSSVSSMGLVLPLGGTIGRLMFDKIHNLAPRDKRFWDPTIVGDLGVGIAKN